MSALTTTTLLTPSRKETNGQGRDLTPFDRKLDEILRKAAAVFCARGYHHASIRDISRSTRVSLAGLYHYFRSKDEILYLIQRHAFETILAQARRELATRDDPEERLRAFVRLHLKFFIEHPNEMTVLTHEVDSLGDRRRRDVHTIKKAYYRVCFDLVETLKRERELRSLNTRVAVLSLFGMMNWIYTWYRQKTDPDAKTLAQQMADIFLRGIRGAQAVHHFVRTELAQPTARTRQRPHNRNSNGRRT